MIIYLLANYLMNEVGLLTLSQCYSVPVEITGSLSLSCSSVHAPSRGTGR